MGASVQMSAQKFHVEPIQKAAIKTVQAQLDAYIAGDFNLGASTYTATINEELKKNNHLFDLDFSAGLSTTIYSSTFDHLRFTCSLGYKYGRYVYGFDFFSNLGIHTHWLTSEWKLGLFYHLAGLEAGVAIDGLLHHNIVDVDHFRYIGFHDDCLNNVRVKALVGVFYPFRYCTVEIIFGFELVPPMNMKKISYYNLTQANYEFWTVGIRLYVPIFTTFSNNNAVKQGSL